MKSIKLWFKTGSITANSCRVQVRLSNRVNLNSSIRIQTHALIRPKIRIQTLKQHVVINCTHKFAYVGPSECVKHTILLQTKANSV